MIFEHNPVIIKIPGCWQWSSVLRARCSDINIWYIEYSAMGGHELRGGEPGQVTRGWAALRRRSQWGLGIIATWARVPPDISGYCLPEEAISTPSENKTPIFLTHCLLQVYHEDLSVVSHSMTSGWVIFTFTYYTCKLFAQMKYSLSSGRKTFKFVAMFLRHRSAKSIRTFRTQSAPCFIMQFPRLNKTIESMYRRRGSDDNAISRRETSAGNDAGNEFPIF